MKFIYILLSLSLYAEVSFLSLGNLGSVRYTSDELHLLQIERLSPSEEVMYTHYYEYDSTGKLTSEKLIGELGRVFYENEMIISPFSLEICEYDANHNVIKYTLDNVTCEFTYDSFNQMVSKDGEQCEYDAAGNTISIGENRYVYDENNHLIQVVTPNHSIDYSYDSYGNRVSRMSNGKCEYYLYQGMNEIAIINCKGEIEQLRIPGLSMHKDILRAVAIETKTGIYAPIHDVRGNIIRLIEIANKKVISIDHSDPFGKNLSHNCPTPWIFSGKHYDSQANLVYFGNRYYSPLLKRWLTKDPLEQSLDLYQFCLNNPFIYVDPDGRWAIPIVSIFWGTGLSITCPLWAPYAVASAIGVVASYYAFEYYDAWQRDSKSTQHYHEGDLFSYKIDALKVKAGKQKDGTPKSNGTQNKQFKGAVIEIERKLGKKLSDTQVRILHDYVSKQDYGYHDIVDEGYWLFK